MNRQERVDRQERDDGAAGDEVHLVPIWSGDDVGGASCYHGDSNCHLLLQSKERTIVTVTRQDAQERWRAPCKRCVLGDSCHGGKMGGLK